jgi:PAS domain S-box-containing protein
VTQGRRRTAIYPLAVGVVLAAFYWIVETGIHAYVFKNDSVISHFFPCGAHEIWTRCVVVVLLIGLGIFAWSIARAMRNQREKLYHSRENLRITLNSIGDGVIATDRQGRIVHINRVAASLTGWDSQQAIGKELTEVFSIVNADTRTPCENPVTRALQTGKTQGLANHTILLSKTGEEYQIADSAAAIRDAQGSITGVVLVFRDVTREILVQKRFQLHARVLNQIRDLVTVTDLDGYITYVNQAECRLFGKSAEEIIGNHISTYGTDQGRGPTQQQILQTVKNMGYWRGEVINVTPDGTRVLLDSRVSTVWNDEGEPEAYCGISTDITEQRNLEERLRYSEKMEAVAQLAGGIAHNFNNQLAGIMGYADLMREHARDDETLVRYCDNILLAVKHSSDLTSQLLAYAQKGKYHNIAINVHRLIHETVSLLENSIDKRITLHQELRAERSVVYGDPGQLQSVFMNIALNARDSMPEGGTLTFTTHTVALDDAYCRKAGFNILGGDFIQVEIRDTGIGMSDEVREHIFEPFFTTKNVGEGTGIGLSAAYGTVKNHKGAIEVESKEYEGSVFRIYLPLSGEKEKATGKKSHDDTYVAGKGHILLVDDEELMCDVGKKMLEMLGYSVTVRKNGAEALELYKQYWDSIDCVILDMIMPLMGGKETFIAMRKVNPDVVALLATGYSLKGEAEEILEEGVKGFIQKPFTKAELSRKVAEVMGLSR